MYKHRFFYPSTVTTTHLLKNRSGNIRKRRRRPLTNALLMAFIMIFPAIFASHAQKKALDHTVYDAWKSLQQMSLTDDGRYALCIIRPQEGDDRLLIRQVGRERQLTIPGA